MIKEVSRYQDSTVFEGMTSIRAILKANAEEFNDRKIKTIYYDKAKQGKIIKELGYIKAVSNQFGYEVVERNDGFLSELTVGNSHGGLVAVCSDRTFPTLTEETKLDKNSYYAMIDGIEDPYNFGYALRSLYACGCSGILLGKRNWMSAAGVVCRSSAGASELFRIFTSEDPAEAVDIFKRQNFSIVCAEEKTENLLGECPLPAPLLLIVGGEKRGISKAVLNKADTLVKIPYQRDFRASLSAASATTIFAYEIARQNGFKG